MVCFNKIAGHFGKSNCTVLVYKDRDRGIPVNEKRHILQFRGAFRCIDPHEIYIFLKEIKVPDIYLNILMFFFLDLTAPESRKNVTMHSWYISTEPIL